MGLPETVSRGRILRLVTSWSSFDDFFVGFSRFVNENSVVIVTSHSLAVGERRLLMILLKDGALAMKSWGEVTAVSAPRGAEGTRRAVCFKLIEPDASAKATHRKLLEHAVARNAPKREGFAKPPHRSPRHTMPLGTRAIVSNPPPVPAPAKANPLPAIPPELDSQWETDLPPPATNANPPPAIPPVLEPQGEPEGPLVILPLAKAPSRPAEPSVPETAEPAVSQPPAGEDPMAGSFLFLPANPFAGLPPGALEHFVDCTLYEETGPIRTDIETASEATPPVSIVPPEPRPAEPSPEPPSERAVAALAVLQPIAQKPSRAWPVVVTIVLGAAGLLGGYQLRGLWKPKPKPAIEAAKHEPAVPVAPVAAAIAAPDAAPAIPAAPPEARETPSESEQPAPTCTANIVSRPKGAQVVWGGKPLGTTPLKEASVPCGAAVVVLRHSGFDSVREDVDPQPDAPASVDVSLQRPAGRLQLTSIPPGATFVVDGVAVGKAPTSANVTAFTHVAVSATLPGFKTWAQALYVKERRMSVRAQLEPVPAERKHSLWPPVTPGEPDKR